MSVIPKPKKARPRNAGRFSVTVYPNSGFPARATSSKLASQGGKRRCTMISSIFCRKNPATIAPSDDIPTRPTTG